jgi:hypothetical protein
MFIGGVRRLSESVAVPKLVTFSIVILLVIFSVPQIVRASPLAPRNEGSSLDGVGACGVGASSFCPWQLITTSQDGDIVILAVWCHCSSDAPSIADDAGLDYTLRASHFAVQTPGPGFPLSLWEYYAIAPSVLDSDNITLLNADSSLATGSYVQAFAVQPGNTETVFDPNSALPNIVACPGVDLVNGGYQDCSASAGPLANDFAFVVTAINDAGPCPDPASFGFVELAPLGGNLDVDYQVVAQPGTVAFTCSGGNAPGTDPMAMILDAIPLDPGS